MANGARCRTVEQTVKEYPWLTRGRLRRLLLHRETNGLAGAVLKLTGQLLIDLDAFDRWLERFRGEGQRLGDQGVGTQRGTHR
jgi:hypothetical protein